MWINSVVRVVEIERASVVPYDPKMAIWVNFDGTTDDFSPVAAPPVEATSRMVEIGAEGAGLATRRERPPHVF